MKERWYVAIDLKSFYASVECNERGFDPLTTNLVVADPARTNKTICLAVSPALKSFGIPGRPRLFEVVRAVEELNKPRYNLWKKEHPDAADEEQPVSFSLPEILSDPGVKIGYITAPPRMKYYIDYSTTIYDVYLQYVSQEDIFAYSIDEVFIDVTSYLKIYGCSAHDLAMRMIRDVLRQSGITATCGIGTNLYLAKIAMDIVAKHMEPDTDGVRIAQLEEMSYRRLLWNHRPLTDFWRVGAGTVRRLAKVGLHTMGDVARCSVGAPGDYYNMDLLYRLFGIGAELLIDHAWGYEPCTIEEVKRYEPENRSLSSSQVLQKPYPHEKGALIVREMAELAALDLVKKNAVSKRMTLTIGYDIENLTDPVRRNAYKGKVHRDFYGRLVPEHAHGTWNFAYPTSSSKEIADAMTTLYEKITDPVLLVRRVSIAADMLPAKDYPPGGQRPGGAGPGQYEQLSFFTDFEAVEKEKRAREEARAKELSMQKAILDLQRRFGKNTVLKGMNFEEDAMTIERNGQIGGHRAGVPHKSEGGSGKERPDKKERRHG